MIIRLHNPFVAENRPKTAKIEETPTPLSYEQRVNDDRIATLFFFFLLFAGALVYLLLN